MARFAIVLLFFTIVYHAQSQELSVTVKGQLFVTILQGKISRNVRWISPRPGEQGFLGFELFYPRSIVRDSQEIAYHLDMCQQLFLSFFSSRDLHGLHRYEVDLPVNPGHAVDSYDLQFDANFHDMQQSEFMRLERLTRAIPYFAWSNYLAITSKERDRVVINLKDAEQMTPDSCRDDYCDVVAFFVYYYVFRQHLDKPLQVIYRWPGNIKRYDYPLGYDYKKILHLFINPL